MLSGKKISITAKTFIEDVEIANYGAILDVESGDLSFYTRQIDKSACKEHRDVVRADAAQFEDFAYSVQENVATLND